MNKEEEKSLWEKHRDRRYKERNDRYKNWSKIRKKVYEKYE